MDKIKNYVDNLFKEAPSTKKTRELKEELLLDLEEKYNDLVADGKKESEAYNEVISGIGDIDELLNVNQTVNSDENALRRRNALVVSICVGLYIMAFIVAIVLEEIVGADDSIIGISLFAICGLSTCILIYNNMSKPRYLKKDDTMVEEFKEWKENKNKDNAIRKSISSILWTLITILYFVISFATMAWYITWVMFIIGGLIEEIINLIFKIKE